MTKSKGLHTARRGPPDCTCHVIWLNDQVARDIARGVARGVVHERQAQGKRADLLLDLLYRLRRPKECEL